MPMGVPALLCLLVQYCTGRLDWNKCPGPHVQQQGSLREMQGDARHRHVVAVRTGVAKTQFPLCSGKMKAQHLE